MQAQSGKHGEKEQGLKDEFGISAKLVEPGDPVEENLEKGRVRAQGEKEQEQGHG